MDRNEFRQALCRHRISCEEFAELIGRHRETVYKFGEATPVPYYARLILRLLDERGGVHGLMRSHLKVRYKLSSDTSEKTLPTS